MSRRNRRTIRTNRSSAPDSQQNLDGSELNNALLQLKNSPLFSVVRDNAIGIVVGIIAAFLLSPLGDQLPEPIGSKENFSYYFSLNLVNSEIAKKTEQVSMFDDITTVVINPKKEQISINTIRVRGIAEIHRCVVAIRNTDTDSKNLPVNCTFDKEKELVTISNVGVVPQNATLIANIWGTVGDNIFPAIQLSDGKFVWPSQARLVEGRLLFLSDYWNLILVIISITMLGYYYVLKQRIART